MKIFLLEDSVRRVKSFHDLFPAETIIQTACPLEAIRLLANEQFDLIFLDHDLSEITTSKAPGTGYQVAEFLGNNSTPNDQTIITIHSMNPIGAEDMLTVLQSRKAQRILYTELFNSPWLTSKKFL